MRCSEVLLEFRQRFSGSVWVSENQRAYDHDQMHAKSLREGWAEGYAEHEGNSPVFWKLGRLRYHLVVPSVLKIEGAPLGTRTTAEAIARADGRLTPIKYDGEWMLWGWNEIKEEPFLVAVEYWLASRAEVYRRFAEQAMAASRAAEVLLEDEEDNVFDSGIDRALNAGELQPDRLVFFVDRPFPDSCLEKAVIS